MKNIKFNIGIILIQIAICIPMTCWGANSDSLIQSVEGQKIINSNDIDEHALLKKIENLYQQEFKNGWFKSKVIVKINENDEFNDSPGYLIPNFSRSECTLYISPKAIIKYGFGHDFELRFFTYHEVSHCELYMNTASLKILPLENESSHLLLSDLVQLEFLHPSAPRRVNGYNLYHENYADIKAIAILLSSNFSINDINKVINFRGTQTKISDTHETYDALLVARDVEWIKLNKEQVEAKIQLISGFTMLKGFFVKVFNADLTPFKSSSLLNGSIRTILSASRFKYSDPSEKEFVDKRINEILLSGNPLWEVFAKLEKSEPNDDKLIAEFFQTRYKKTPEQMKSIDEEILQKINYFLKNNN